MCLYIQIHESGTNKCIFLVGIHFAVSRIHFISTLPCLGFNEYGAKNAYYLSHSFEGVADSLHLTSDSFKMTTDTFRFANPASENINKP
jgi:hypothetical protein